MSADRQLPALRAELRPSLQLAVLLAVAHLAAMTIAIVFIPRLEWAGAAGALIATSGLWSIRRHALLRHRGSIVAFELKGENDCALLLRDGVWLQAVVLRSSYVTHGLIVLNLRVAGKLARRHVVILPATLPGEVRRRLRVRLRWSRPETPTDETPVPPL